MATDQEIRDAGFKYIPRQEFLRNPFVLPTTDDDNDGGGSGGIPNTNAGSNFSVYNPDPNSIVNKTYDPYRYRNAIENSFLYGGSNATNPKYLNQSFDPSGQIKNAQFMYNKAFADLKDPLKSGYTETFGTPNLRPSQQVMDYYGEKILDNQERYRTQGQYETVPSEFAYSSQTELDKFKDNYPEYFASTPLKGIPGAIQKYAKNSFLGKGLGVAKDFLNNILPTNTRAILENELGGQGIMVNDIGQIVAANQGSAYDPSGENIMAGYNAYHVDQSTFDKRRAKAKKNMTTKGFLEFDKALTEAEKKFMDAKKKTGVIVDDEDDDDKKKKKNIIERLFLNKKKKKTAETTDDGTTTGGGYTGTPGGNTGSGNFANIDNSGKTFGPYTETSYAPQYTDQDDARERRRDTTGEGNNTGGSKDSGSKDTSKGGIGSAGFGGMFHGADGGRVYFFDGGRVAVMNGGLVSLL